MVAPERRHEGDHHQQLQQQRDVGHDAEGLVVEQEEHQHEQEGEQHRLRAALHVLGAQARADDALLGDHHRRRQRAGLEQAGQVLGLVDRLQAGGLELAAEHALDGRGADHFLVDLGGAHFLAVDDLLVQHRLDVHRRHLLADVVLGELEHAVAADLVERHAHRRRARLRVHLEAGVDQLVAGGDGALGQQDRLALAVWSRCA
jgi:hypothetical protein